MKITFADSFWDSLDRLGREETWWYKTFKLFRYKIPMFFENLWFFRKQLWEFRSWDYSYNLKLLGRSLEKTVNTIEFHGQEVEISRMKKVAKIKRAIELINSFNEGDYIEKAENVLGELKNLDGWRNDRDDTPEEKEHNGKVFKLARKIEDDEWNELWDILRGQNHQEYVDLLDSLSDEQKREKDVWNNWHDGSGMRGWWE